MDLDNGNGSVVEDDIGDLFEEADNADKGVSAAEGEATEETEKKPAEPNPDIIALKTELGTIKEQQAARDRELAALRTENALATRRLEELSRPKEAEVDEDEEDKKINEALSKGGNPAKIIRRLAEEAAQKARDESRQHTSRELEIQNGLDRDREKVINEFGTQLNKFPEFRERALEIYNDEFGGRGRTYAAVAMAHSELVRAGKLKEAKELIQKPANPILGRSTNEADNSEADDVYAGFSERELAVMKKNMQRMGISEKDWKAELRKQRKMDSRYGER